MLNTLLNKNNKYNNISAELLERRVLKLMIVGFFSKNEKNIFPFYEFSLSTEKQFNIKIKKIFKDFFYEAKRAIKVIEITKRKFLLDRL